MMVSIGRRQFIATLSGAAACSLAARAQQAAVPVIGFIGGSGVAWLKAIVLALMIFAPLDLGAQTAQFPPSRFVPGAV